MNCILVSRKTLPGINQGTPFNKKYLDNSNKIRRPEIQKISKYLRCDLSFNNRYFNMIKGKPKQSVKDKINRIKIIKAKYILVSP